MSEKNLKECLDTIKDIRSVRNYVDQPIEKEVLKNIVDCARMAPTARNIQPWEFVVVTDKDKLKNISEIIPQGEFIKSAAAGILVFCHKNTEYFLEDGSAATQNILVSARFHGLKSCWIAGYQGPYYENDDIPMCEGVPCTPIPDLYQMQSNLKKEFEVPEGFELISVVSLGYSNDNPPADKRALADVIHWNTFNKK
ncbi:nitroreductase family protein [Isachenkonia alkalipeptolytica]|uniref:Nitroreductase family protein n=1 Tax=Isachenkonia alkalipeptolytica TaxID=2565777 RepID=A0AA44BF51_9CLOT|nr:nitroreductase family protein [Isachenkonia alkalipeptolytica]NBG89638.1 nitroreductase family protein [Isachenkonia alkalipeptolytica]